MKFDIVIVGAGLAGIVFAERFASQLNKKVLVIEKRNHIGGNLYDYYNKSGILIHKYGPHIFRTYKKHVWDYLGGFSDWHYYQHKVAANVQGQEVPFPINLDTYNILSNTNLCTKEFEEVLKSNKFTESPKNAEEATINQVGRYLYEAFFKNYTIKQWGKEPSELSAETVARVPVKTDRENRYFQHKYQGLPLHGYTHMLQNMLNVKGISIMLNTDYKNVIDSIHYEQMIYTGPLDYFFDYRCGQLEYRSLRFEERTYDQESFQSHSVINYPNNYDYTRITEYKKLTGQVHPKTAVHYEFPQAYDKNENEPYYPILDNSNMRLKNEYLMEADMLLRNVLFVGRLAEYRYYAMDELVEHCLQLFKDRFSNK